jgi:hypothetical protein
MRAGLLLCLKSGDARRDGGRGTRVHHGSNWNQTAICYLFPALPRERRAKGCTARIVPNHLAFEKRNDSPAATHRCDTASTPTGFAEIVSDDFPIPR